jgi:hypothetical protein
LTELPGTVCSQNGRFIVDEKYSFVKARANSFAPIMSAISGIADRCAAQRDVS